MTLNNGQNTYSDFLVREKNKINLINKEREKEKYRKRRIRKRDEKEKDKELYHIDEKLIRLKESGVHRKYNSNFTGDIKRNTNKKARKSPCQSGCYYKKLIQTDMDFYYI